MDKKILKAESRKIEGRKVKRLRKEGVLPANVFGKKIKSKSITVKIDDFNSVFKDVGETGLVSLKVTGEKEDRAVLISNVQLNPVSDLPIHVDFHQVDLKEKVTADVPVELVGESPAEKQSLGTVVLYIDEIEVEALPTDLPERLVVDVSKLERVDQSISVKDLDIERTKVEVKTSEDEIVVKVEPPQKEEIVEEVAPAAEGEEEAPSSEGEAKEEGQKEGESKKEESPQEKAEPQQGRN